MILPLNIQVENQVNRLDLRKCLQLLARTQMRLVADGGAMHMGEATNAPDLLTLFIRIIPP